jgi:hypothetical protein
MIGQFDDSPKKSESFAWGAFVWKNACVRGHSHEPALRKRTGSPSGLTIPIKPSQGGPVKHVTRPRERDQKIDV